MTATPTTVEVASIELPVTIGLAGSTFEVGTLAVPAKPSAEQILRGLATLLREAATAVDKMAGEQ